MCRKLTKVVAKARKQPSRNEVQYSPRFKSQKGGKKINFEAPIFSDTTAWRRRNITPAIQTQSTYTSQLGYVFTAQDSFKNKYLIV